MKICVAGQGAFGIKHLEAIANIGGIEVVSLAGTRRIPLADFIVGNRKTQRRTEEILSQVYVPRAVEGAASTFLKLGARRYIDSGSQDVAAELNKEGGAAVILVTAPDPKAIGALVDGLGVRGRLVVVGASADPFAVSSISLIGAQRTIVGWASGTSKDSEDTLKFAAQTGVRAMIETFPIERAAEGYEKMMTGKVRFRAVLTH